MENSWTKFWWLSYFWFRCRESSPLTTCLHTCLTCFCVFQWKPSMYAEACFWMFIKVPSCRLCLFFFQERTWLISLCDCSWRLLLHGYLTPFQEMIDQVKLQAFPVLCAHFVHFWSRSWMLLNTGHTEACFILGICPNVAFVCFRMCWRILMTLLLQ